MHGMPPEYTKQRLFFYVAQDLDASIKFEVRRLIDELSASRTWSASPPLFIDELDGNGLEIVGGLLEIYSALPLGMLPLEVDSKNLEEVEALINAVKILSKNKDLSFEFQLDSTYVGSVEDGVIDRVLRDGLLVPWRNYLNEKGLRG